MTFEQLNIFLAVAEREHLTRAAAALRLTPSAVSASIKALEGFYAVRLFSRVGRGIELTPEGRVFLREARETMARVRSAELVLGELGGLRRGRVVVQASQTIANYWLPARLMRFRARYPGVEIALTLGNTQTVAQAVLEGGAELGFIEGEAEVPALRAAAVGEDRLVVVVPAGHAAAGGGAGSGGVVDPLALRWILREPGSGTRAVFEAGLRALGIDPAGLEVALVLPSNEAVVTAVLAGQCATAVSEAVVAPLVAGGRLAVLDVPMPPRAFTLLRHGERYLSAAARALVQLVLPAA